MSYKADLLIVGCGFGGATFARLAAESGKTVHMIDRRNHIGGNSYSFRDAESGVEVHKYGPHIFHTSAKDIWQFINRFTSFNTYVNRVKAISNGSVYTLPINLLTINQYFHKTFNPIEAEQFIESLRVKNPEVRNFEEYVISSIGIELYNAFFKYYTLKQWGVDPKEINISTAKRLPIRFTYDDNYFTDAYQGIPTEGYTKIFERMLDHPHIKIMLENDYSEHRENWRKSYKNLIFTGSLDEYFQHQYGPLPYRTVTFKEMRGIEIQGNAVINYTDLSVKHTRIHEHKWFQPELKVHSSIAFEEYSDFATSDAEPYYPVRNPLSDKLYDKYLDLCKLEEGVWFLGRLAEFRYYDMHQVIGSASAKFKEYIKALK
jgi:UDP-galactopyranose mutase